LGLVQFWKNFGFGYCSTLSFMLCSSQPDNSRYSQQSVQTIADFVPQDFKKLAAIFVDVTNVIPVLITEFSHK